MDFFRDTYSELGKKFVIENRLLFDSCACLGPRPRALLFDAGYGSWDEFNPDLGPRGLE